MDQKMVEHHASVTVDAPIHQVYSLFSHFNDFPKFMSFVKEVTYYDDQRSHWVADVAGRHEWDAVNEDWIPDRQIGWRSSSGLKNTGRVVFQPTSAQQTHLDVYVDYEPPAGFFGNVGEHLGVGKHFEDALQKDLNHFATMVHQAPAGALDPTSSNYLFHSESAAARGTTTERQDATMREQSTRAKERGTTTQGQGATSYSQGYSTPAGTGPSSGPGYVSPIGAGPSAGQDYVSPAGTGTPAGQGYASPAGSGIPAREGTVPPEKPTLDKDIINEPASAAPQRNAGTPPGYVPENEENLPPEQIPRWESPEGNQPRP
ncbi:MAG TPA: SRPBCC family protein [Ktedonobacteraceae bacterium]|nr:SRPBCC family protein [Ktedonobacteraceae bacterium]